MIVIENVYKIYNEEKAESYTALKGINLEIEKGSTVILSGVSGSGKSTLLSLIGGLDKPSSGKIMVEERLISKLPDLHASAYRSQTVGMVFQHFNLIESLSVEENIIAALIPLRLPLNKMQEMTQESMELANISHKASQQVNALSGGEKQRCAIARALVNRPNLILCDEPTANLDKANTLKFIEILKTLRQLGKTIVIATHDPIFQALDFIDQTYFIEDGTIRSE
jgi:putative ABC transport system ATP-binding protein